MISVEEALDRVLSHFSTLEEEEKPVLECLGQVLSRDVRSEVDIPPRANTAMDGYAVRCADTVGASETSPRILKVIGTLAAGYVSQQKLTPGSAIRIMTGAPIPDGADCVVQFEHTDELARKEKDGAPGQNSEIGILREARPRLNIREAGEDISRGQVVFAQGAVLRPAEIGVIASLGMVRIWVIRRPEVAILATGDELIEAGNPLLPGKIYNSNTYSIAALVLKYGGIPRILGIGCDNEAELIDKIHQARGADILVTSGGVSAGDYDLVKKILAQEGEIGFWIVRQRPGKPMAFGTIRSFDKNGQPKDIPHLGLPGNPVSSMVTFELYVRAAMRKMMGKKGITKPSVEVIMETPARNTDGRRVFARAIVSKREGKYYATLTGPQGSGILTSMSLGNALVIVPEDVKQLKPGETTRALMLDWNED